MATLATIAGLKSRFETAIVLDSLEEADTSRPETGEDITKWSDSAGSNDLVTGGNSPSYVTGAPNGQGHVLFVRASEETLVCDNTGPLDTPIDSPHTSFIVGAFTAPADGALNRAFTLQTKHMILIKWTDDKVLCFGDAASIDMGAADTDYHIFTVQGEEIDAFNDMLANAWLDAVSKGTDVEIEENVGDPVGDIQLGGQAGQYADFKMAACIVYEAELGADDRQRVEWYLDQTYGLGLGIVNPDWNYGGGGMTGVGTFPQDG